MSDREWLQGRAREFRSNLTDAEAILWSRLQRRQLGGYRIRRQHVIGRFVLDFYCAEKQVAIEVDDPITHHEARDARRDRLLRAAGILMLRVDNADVYQRPDETLGRIVDFLDAAAPRRRNSR